MNSPAILYVHHHGHLVGTIQDAGFDYAPSWLADTGAFPLSQTLPLQSETFEHALAWRWLTNLLPEGEARQRIASRLRISSENDRALIQALGRDCAGAITIGASRDPIPTNGNVPAQWASYRRLERETMVEMTRSPGVVASLLGDEVRLSLAGAQDKIPVRRGQDGTIYLPLAGAPSTHLLKCPNQRFANLVDNERLCLELARAVGLPAVHAEVLNLDGRPLLLIEPFDRGQPEHLASPQIATDGTVLLPNLDRIHQEDFAQALARAPYEKYESEGGPSFAECMKLVRTTAHKPAGEIALLLRWSVYCLIIGNRDNHAKNLARLRHERHWTLAPFYDLVCTTAYPKITAKLAMRIGGIDDVAKLSRKTWVDEAGRIKVGVRLLLTIVEELCERVEAELPAVIDTIAAELGRGDQLAVFSRAIKKGIRSTRRSAE